MKLNQFRLDLQVGLYDDYPLDKVLEAFSREYYNMGRFNQYPEYKSFVFNTRENLGDKDNFIQIMEMITEKFLHIDKENLQATEVYMTKIALEGIKPSNEMFFRVAYAVYSFMINNIEKTEYNTIANVWQATRLTEMTASDYSFNTTTGIIESSDLRISVYSLVDCLMFISTLTLCYGDEIYLEDNGTIILPDALRSGMTVIFYARTNTIEIVYRVMYPTSRESFRLLSRSVASSIQNLIATYSRLQERSLYAR